MKSNRMSWNVIASNMLVAATFAPLAFAQAAFAQDPPADPTNPSFVADGHNGLSSKAFRHNALTTNKEALRKLLNHPLDDALFLRDDGYIGRQLRDPGAMAMIEELVECALDSKTTVTARDREGTVKGQWRGELGLCQSWHTHDLKESETCQELVTACVMARVNALGKRIPLSLRSEAPILSSTRDEVLTETRFQESPPREDPSEGWPIPSFSTDCRGRECNWSPAYVGTCTPGSEIQLAIEDAGAHRDRKDRKDGADSSACDSMALRACAGLYGCLGPSVHELPGGAPLPPYTEHLGEKSSACRKSPLKFTCPSGDATAGFYSVMTRQLQKRPRNEPSRRSTVVKVNGTGLYPAPQKDVFRFPEGAFFGNMFNLETLTLDCAVNDVTSRTIPCKTDKHAICNLDRASGDLVGECLGDLVTLPYRDVYACYSYAQQMDDDSAVAALNQRLCDAPEANRNCFAYRPQRCHYENTGTGPQKESVCDRMGNDGAFGHCMSQLDHTRRFDAVITTYLNAPCDLLGQGPLCDAVRGPRPPPASPPGGTVTVRPGPRGCGGCSLHLGGGVLQPALLATLLALLLRRRRRRHPGGSASLATASLAAAPPDPRDRSSATGDDERDRGLPGDPDDDRCTVVAEPRGSDTAELLTGAS